MSATLISFISTPFPLPRPPTFPHHHPTKHPPLNQTTPPSSPPPAHPLPLSHSSTLLRRMLSVAVSEENYTLAASLRDAAHIIESKHPTYALRTALHHALQRQDFQLAAALRDKIDRYHMLVVAERCKPRYPLGLVVLHRRTGCRMVLFGADFRNARNGDGVGGGGEAGQTWYHAAVDERDCRGGENVVYVAEEDCVPAAFGVSVEHPIIRIMFRGMKTREVCGRYSWYVCAGNEGEEEEESAMNVRAKS